MRTGRKPGPKPRGLREALSVRVPVDQHSVYVERAAEMGIPLSSWTALKLAQAEGLPIPDYVQEDIRKAAVRRALEAGQEELPLARAG